MLNVQKNLSARKEKSAGRFEYRSAEDIYEKIKAFLDEPLKVTTSLVEFSGRVFIEAKVTYKDYTSNGYAELEKDPKNMSIGQATGAATSFAIKYALCMLFLIDNGEDLDKRPPKQVLFDKLESAGVSREDMKRFYDAYCTSESMLIKVIDNFDLFLNEWKTDRERL